MEYASFAGKIPQGEYGGGDVMVWDHGTYDALKWSEREVMVVLHGERAQGTYVLFCHRQDHAGRWQGGSFVDDPQDGRRPRGLRAVAPGGPAHARHVGRAAQGRRGLGVRVQVGRDSGHLVCRRWADPVESRNGNDLTHSFPELRALGEQLGSRRVVLDGEIVAFDDGGPSPVSAAPAPDPRLRRPQGRRSWPRSSPWSTSCFDVLYIDGESLLGLSYVDRRRRLEAPGTARHQARALDTEPAVRRARCRRAPSQPDPGPRRGARQAPRLALSAGETVAELDEGEEPSHPGGDRGRLDTGRRQREGRLGSLLLGIPADQPTAAGTGLIHRPGRDGLQRVDPRRPGRETRARRATRNPFVTPVPSRYANVAQWVKPTLVGEVSFSEWTNDGRLRHPSWRGLRDDKSPDEVRRES